MTHGPGDPHGAARSGFEEDEVELIDVAAALGRNLHLLVGIPIIAAILMGGIAVLRGPEFTATSVFQPHMSEAGLSGLSSLASQFGVPIGSGDAGQSPQFYAKLLESEDILRAVASTRFEFEEGEDEERRALSGDLPELYETDGDTPDERLRAAVEVLHEAVSVQPDLEAGVVELRTRAPWGQLAEQLNARLLELVSDFNQRTRRSNAAAERAFVESRLRQAQDSLLLAESALERFLSDNRTFQTSPALTFEAGRLQRRVDLQQQVYTSLAQLVEQARIDEVRNTPVITIVDRPDGSAEPEGGLLRFMLIGFVLGGLSALLWVGSREFRRARPGEYRKLASALSEAAPASLRRRFGRSSRKGDSMEVSPRESGSQS